MHLSVVVNPAARAGTVRSPATRAVACLREHGHRVDVHAGATAADTAELVRRARDSAVDGVVVVGGDGTVRLAAQELAGTAMPLGIVAAGTGNDFAAHVGIPTRDAERAASVIAEGRTRVVDLARARLDDGTESIFGTVLASGFDSRVNDRANRMRWPRGDMRYNLAIAVEFVLLHRYSFRISVDDETVEGPLLLAAIGNMRSYGGEIPICPDADCTDGLLDVTLVHPAGRVTLARIVAATYRGRHTALPQVQTLRGRTVRIESADVTAYADGDRLGPLPVSVECLPAALTVFAPQPGISTRS